MNEDLDFNKFIKDIEKRQKKNSDKRFVDELAYSEEMAKRLRNERYNERWQNRIVWDTRNE